MPKRPEANKRPLPAIPPSPAGLSDRSAALWAQLVPAKALSPGRVILLENALRCLDRADQAARQLDAEGLILVTEKSGASHLNPLAKLERENRSLFAKIWEQLHLTFSDLDGFQNPFKPSL